MSIFLYICVYTSLYIYISIFLYKHRRTHTPTKSTCHEEREQLEISICVNFNWLRLVRGERAFSLRIPLKESLFPNVTLGGTVMPKLGGAVVSP